MASVVDDESLLGADLLKLARWMADYYVHPVGEVLRTMLPAGVRGRGRLSPDDGTDGKFPHEPEYPELNKEQSAAFEAVTGAVHDGKCGKFLLHGVTGSGKTEVYLRCIDEALEMGKSALVLIPEIALIPQTTSRFRRRFGVRVAVLHSRLTGAQRHAIWKGAAGGEYRVVIGARSAVFVPLSRLGIIVVDEEQDQSFKQEEKPHYNAVRVAEIRARNEGAVLLLGSATPSLEAYELARKGEIKYLKLRSRPVVGRMPRVQIVDMRKIEGVFSDELLEALEGCITRREQAIILINRRGHANFVQCRKCGWIDRCRNCSISLTYHSRGHRLTCHYCGYERNPPDSCPECGAYRVVHRGIGTQRVEMELMNLLPGARVTRMDLDTTAGRRGHLDILEMFSEGTVDILLGTQMVAKGHHYPNVTLVGVLLADNGLNFPDFRAAERTFQLLSQAAGRTGRGEKGGRVIVQTYSPDHYMYGHLAEHDFDGFAMKEMALRHELGYPPVGGLVLFTISSSSAESAYRSADRISGAIEDVSEPKRYEVLGPTQALIERLRGKYRVQVMVKGRLGLRDKRRMVEAARRSAQESKGTSVQWNVDPFGFS